MSTDELDFFSAPQLSSQSDDSESSRRNDDGRLQVTSATRSGSDKSIITNASVDSGIHMDCLQEVNLRNKSGGKSQQKLRLVSSKSLISNGTGDARASSKSRSISSKSLLSNLSMDLGGKLKSILSNSSLDDSLSKSASTRRQNAAAQCTGSCQCAVKTTRQHVRAAIQSRFMVQMTMRQNRMQREQDFLRASLRESKKLQNLEKRAGAANGSAVAADGFVNRAFDRDGGEDEAMANAASRSPSSKAKSLETPRVDVGDAVSTQQILSLLHALRSKLGNNSNELRVMNNLFNNVQFQDSVSLYNKVTKAKKEDRPVSSQPETIAPDVYAAIQKSESKQAKQLQDILSRPPFKDALVPPGYHHHHHVASHTQSDEDFSPAGTSDSRVSTLEKVDQYGETNIDVIQIHKSADPLGATVKNEGELVVIGRIVRGGVADKSGLLHEGDELLEVNGIPMRGKTINEVSDLLAGMTGQLEFVIIPSGSNREYRETAERKTSVRALFDYDPEEDQFIPCQELGVSFTTGDILHIINQEDPNWWQAYREGEEDQALAGLVPSKLFWENREQLRLQILADTAEAESQAFCCPSGLKKRKKSQYNADEIDTEDILTYEEVTRYYPQPNRKRPIVLIGPPDVGRKELRQRLLETDPERFAAAIPHTSRIRREDEEDGKDYYFTARHLFEADIRANKFVEHGHFQKDFYGTSLESIRSVVHSGKICVLNLHPQALKSLRVSDVKPYVVFIAAPNLQKLKDNISRTTGKEPSVEHCKNIMDKGREMETKYGHYFDFIINNNDIDNAFNELLNEINRLEVVGQWVPSDWLK